MKRLNYDRLKSDFKVIFGKFLSPLLYTMYTEDSAKNPSTILASFADDKPSLSLSATSI